MHKQRPGCTQLQLELPNSLKKWLTLNIARSTANFYHRHISAISTLNDPAFDFIGDVRNHLHRATQIVTAALFTQHSVVNSPGGEVITLRHGRSGKALVVSQIQIGLGTIIGHEHLAVLERAHRTGIKVYVGV